MNPEAYRRMILGLWVSRIVLIAIEALIAVALVVFAVVSHEWLALIIVAALGGLVAWGVMRYRRDRARAAARGWYVGPRI